MGRVIYVVTHGDYEDYRIAAVFEGKDLAKRLAEQLLGSVETYRVRTGMPRRKTLYHVEIDDAGTITDQYQTDHWDFDGGAFPEASAGAYAVGEGAWAESYRSYGTATNMAREALKRARAGKEGV